jgi:hypothetical protein
LISIASWSTSRIHPSWPQSWVRLRLLLLSSISILLACLGPPSVLLFTPTTHVSRSNPPLPAGQLNTNVQVNNMATLQHIYTVAYIYITFTLLLIPFLILLPLFWAGWLTQTLLVCYTNGGWLFVFRSSGNSFAKLLNNMTICEKMQKYCNYLPPRCQRLLEMIFGPLIIF